MRVRGPISLAIALVLPIAIAWIKFGGDHAALSDSIAAAIDEFPETGDAIAADLKKGARFESVDVAEAAPGSAASFLASTPEGLVATGPIAAGVRNEPVLIEEVISGYGPGSDEGVPAMVMAIRPIGGCRLTPPAEGAAVGYVTAGASGLDLPLSTYDDRNLARGVQSFVDALRAGEANPGATLRGPSYEAYDVAVTETRDPVYLVLENRTGNRIWNIHAAEGVQIERVILLGGGQAGVANLDPVVPVEVILQDGLTACGIRPVHRLNLGQDAALAETGEPMTAADQAEAARAYDNWFRDSFGVLASETRAGFDVGTISVVGPVPREATQRAEYVPVHGATLRTTRNAYFEIAGQVAEGEDFASRVKAIAKTFAFGDLNYLRQGAKF